MRTKSLVLAIVFVLGCSVTPILAHHSVRGSHDDSKMVTIAATIARAIG